MSHHLLFCLCAVIATARPATADYQVKGYAPGWLEYPNMPVPAILDMDGDPGSPELVIRSCYNGQCDIGVANVYTGAVSWLHFSDEGARSVRLTLAR